MLVVYIVLLSFKAQHFTSSHCQLDHITQIKFHPPTPELTMKEAFISPDTQVEIREVPIPVPKAGELLIKVAVSGTSTYPLSSLTASNLNARYKPQRLEGPNFPPEASKLRR